MKKYKLTQETLEYKDHTLYRIEALKNFNSVRKGDKGGFVESEENLSQDSNCWVGDNAKVYGDARIYGNANIYGNAKVYGDAEIHGEIIIADNSEISRDSDYIVFKNWWSSGRYFTWTKSNNMWRAGCFYGSGEELITKAYENSELSGREYEKIVKYVESILEDE